MCGITARFGGFVSRLHTSEKKSSHERQRRKEVCVVASQRRQAISSSLRGCGAPAALHHSQLV